MNGDDRRTQVIAAARRAMNEFGVRRVTVSDIAREANVSRQTLYEHFPNREALIAAALEEGARHVVARGLEAGRRAGGTREQQMRATLAYALRFFRQSPLWSSPAKRGELVPHVTVEGGVFLAANAAAMAEGLAVWWPEADSAVIRRVADTTSRFLVSHGLAPEQTDDAVVAAEFAAIVAAALSV